MNAPPAMPPRIEEIRSLSRFREVEGPWNDLCDRAIESCPTLRHAFLRGWLDAFGSGLELRILLAWQGDELVGAAPFASSMETLFQRELRVISLLSNSWMDRSSLLLARSDPTIVEAMLRHLRESPEPHDLLALGPLGDSSVVSSLIREVARAQGWRHGEEPGLQSPYMRAPASWETLLEHLSPSFRASLRRKLHHVAKIPEVSMRIVEDESCLAVIRSISPETWQAAEGTAMTSRPEILALYETVIRDAARSGSLRCGELYLGDLPVAFDLNILQHGTLYSIKLGFQSSHAALSAGVVLKAYLLRTLLASGATSVLEYDFMGAAEPYKLNWTSDIRSHSRHFIFSPGAAMSSTHWLVFRARPFLRERLPGLWAVLKRLTRAVSRAA